VIHVPSFCDNGPAQIIRDELYALALAASKRHAKRSDRSENAKRTARRTAQTNALRARATSMPFGRAFAIAALGIAISVPRDFNLEKALQVRHTLVELFTDVDILPIAEKRAIGLAACGFAPPLELGLTTDVFVVLTIDLTAHVDVGFT